MALGDPVEIQASRLDASILPVNVFSQSYLLYVIQQGSDLGNVANKANEAGQGADEAQKKNVEQDVILDDHEKRIAQTESSLTALANRVSATEQSIDAITITLLSYGQRIGAAELGISSLSTNKADKTEVLLKTNNLSDLPNKTTARTSLGLGDSSTRNVGNVANTVAAGDDSRLGTVDQKSGGTITSTVTVSGWVQGNGFGCRNGTAGTTTTNRFNIFWTSAGKPELWIDNTRIGFINITP